LEFAREAFRYLPWVIGVGLLGARLAKKTPLNPLGYFVGAAVPHGLLLAWVLYFPAFDNWRHQESFTPDGWRSPAGSSDRLWPPRLRMVDDLIARKLVDGLSQDSVVLLLGPPDARAWPGFDMTYSLGPERGLFRIDSEFLALRLRSGHVDSVALVRD
jgi:hypothetical protein